MSEDLEPNGFERSVERDIQDLRWHTTRYDALRATVATRASFLMAADAALIAGVAFLIPSATSFKSGFERVLGLAAACGGGLVLVLVALSLSAGSRALLATRHWRDLYGVNAPSAPFYQHSDTLKVAPDLDAFQELFLNESPHAQRRAAMINLWLLVMAHADRYGYLRKSLRYLHAALLTLVAAVVALLAASLIG
jgi:hypothetical protein